MLIVVGVAVGAVAIVHRLASGNELGSDVVPFDTADARPDWSPDGRLIAFDSNRAGGGIYLIHPDGGGLRRLIRAPGASDVDWSPKGRLIAFAGNDGIYVVSAIGGSERRVLRGKQFSLPAWAPNGKRLAIVKEEPDSSSSIYTVRPDGRRLRRLLPRFRGAVGDAQAGSPAALSESEPAWSPDGASIAFEAGDGQLVTASVKNGRRQILVSKGAYEPAWSPDGKLIAYQCAGDVCVVNAQGGASRRLATGGGSPSWAPDARRLVFERYLYGGSFYGSNPSSLSAIDIRDRKMWKLTFGPRRLRTRMLPGNRGS